MNPELIMARALRLAAQGLFTTDPNPRVGCVLVRDGDIVGEGWHERAGAAHAEINALAAAGDKARGAECYVTLEPCCHHGRTPPCSDALIAAGVKKVIAAMEDPNPLVAGTGLKLLAAAGIEVSTGLLHSQAQALNPGFIQRMRLGRPFIRVKLAMSVDGRTAMNNGESQWITGSAARSDVQLWRARSSAIMTGVGTILADDPSLLVRPQQFPSSVHAPSQLRQPVRIIIDNHLSTPIKAKILHQEGKTLIFTSNKNENIREQLQHQGATVIVCDTMAGELDLHEICHELGKREYNEILVEAGATLCGALLKAGLIDELLLYMAPILMGDGAKGLFHLPWLKQMAQRIPLDIRDIRAVGQDWRIRACFVDSSL
jgi:diaminohydroxyphosphoribosylaminopyrimidine deaminase / 5-amino-6-(5-phosphoribosylamino)uracil reductase